MVNPPENQPFAPEAFAQPVNQKPCAKCGAPNVADAKFCYKCGQALPDATAPGKKVCAGCGTVNEATSQYCLKCGLKLREGTTAPSAPLEYGGFWLRLGAYVIDNIILNIVSIIIIIALLMLPAMREYLRGFSTYSYSDFNDPGQFPGMFLIYLMQILLNCAYYTFALGKWGTTIGKAACGLKVVRTDGARVSYWRAFARYWAHLLNAMTVGVTYLVIAFHGKKQGIHDMICETLVVKKN